MVESILDRKYTKARKVIFEVLSVIKMKYKGRKNVPVEAEP